MFGGPSTGASPAASPAASPTPAPAPQASVTGTNLGAVAYKQGVEL